MSNKKIDKKLLQEYNEDMKQIGKNIRKWRNDKQISQQELAKKVGLERNSISVIENGSSSVKAVVLLQICKALEISFFDIFKDTQYIQTNPPKKHLDRLAQLNDRDQQIIKEIIDIFYRNQKTSPENLELKSQSIQRKKNSEVFKDCGDEEVDEKEINKYINQFFHQSKYNDDDDYDSYLDY